MPAARTVVLRLLALRLACDAIRIGLGLTQRFTLGLTLQEVRNAMQHVIDPEWLLTPGAAPAAVAQLCEQQA